VCGSAMEAIASASEFLPDLILLDVMMPGMDGMDTLRALREIPATATTPVIFLTARVQPADVALYKELDSLAVIRKPFEPTVLVETIHEIWTRYRGEAH
jgi:two-component system OmpR family response regulator